MAVLSWGMIGAGLAALIAGFVLARRRFGAATGAGKVLVLGPVMEAVALAIFATEHFLDAKELAGIVPAWLPGAMFWTYFVGVALLAAAVSFIAWRCVQWSAVLLAVLFLIIVVTVDLPGAPKHWHERMFWTLVVRETCFASGVVVVDGGQRVAVPEFRGAALRKVVEDAGHLGLRVQTMGSGLAQEQGHSQGVRLCQGLSLAHFEGVSYIWIEREAPL